MVSGFFTSPCDHCRISSAVARPMRISSKKFTSSTLLVFFLYALLGCVTCPCPEPVEGFVAFDRLGPRDWLVKPHPRRRGTHPGVATGRCRSPHCCGSPRRNPAAPPPCRHSRAPRRSSRATSSP